MANESETDFNDGIPVLREVAIPGIPVEDLAPEPEPLEPPRPPRIVVDTDEMLPLIEGLAQQIQAQLEGKMQDMVEAIEVHVRNALHEYEQHMQETIVAQLVDKLPEMISNATYLEPDSNND